MTSATEAIKQKVKKFIYEKLGEDFEDALALRVSHAVSEYEPEWCASEESLRYDDARDTFLDAVVAELFAYSDDASD